MNKIIKTLGMVILGTTICTAAGQAQENEVVFSASDPAPTLKSSDGKFEFNIRGRIMADWSTGSDSNSVNDFSGTKLRAAWFGIEGKATSNIKYKFEADFGGNSTKVKDAYLQFKQDTWSITVGQSKVPNSMEWNTAISQTTFMERAAFKSAFGFGRAFGVKVATGGDNWGFTAGVFQGNNTFSSGTKEGHTAAVRATVGGKIDKATWMVGVSGRAKDLKDTGTITYKAKAITNLSMTMSNFGSNAVKENLVALEAAFTSGPLFGAVEYAFANAKDGIAAGTNAKFSGGYAEVGYILTGESRAINIKSGSWSRPKVNNPVNEGGNGMWMVSARYDKLDLTNNGAFGGEQHSYVASVSWYMTRYIRAMLDYGYTKVNDRTSLGTTNTANVVGLRLNVDW